MPFSLRANARYVLEGQTPVAATSADAWLDFMEHTDRRVLLSELHRSTGAIQVETHFTGWNFFTAEGDGPMFFVTMVVQPTRAPGGWSGSELTFSSSWGQAAARHADMFKALKGVPA